MSTIEIIVSVLIVTTLALVGISVVHNNIKHPCIKSHIEKQWEAPMYMQPGHDGGISIPLSNGKWVDVEVCDQRK